jgi:hypothetical protein
LLASEGAGETSATLEGFVVFKDVPI